MGTSSSELNPESTFMGVARTKIPWWPKIDLEKCDGCNGEYDCLNFCPHRVYRPLEDPFRIEVENRYNCVVFCQACKKMCPKDAISFPSKGDILKLIKAERAK
ncbi:MAG: 4Fe-4S dicluster domain-containing protein [Candidatus Thorarchaeota archaeon]